MRLIDVLQNSRSLSWRLIFLVTCFLLFFTPLACFRNQPDVRFSRTLTAYLSFYQQKDLEFLSVNSTTANLVDIRAESIEDWIKQLEKFLLQVSSFDTVRLNSTASEQILLKKHLQQRLFKLQKLAIWERDAAFYFDLLGNSLFWPLQTETLAPEQQVKIISSRLNQVPQFLQTMLTNIKELTKPQIEISLNKISGLIELLQYDLTDLARSVASPPDSLEQLINSCISDLNQLKQIFEKEKLPTAADGSFFNSQLFDELLSTYFGPELTLARLEELLKKEIDRTQNQVYKIAYDVHRKYFRRSRYNPDDPKSRQELILDALIFISEQRVDGDKFIEIIQKSNEDCERFLNYDNLIRVKKGLRKKIGFLPSYRQELTSFETTRTQANANTFVFLIHPGQHAWKWPQALNYTQYFNLSRLQVAAVAALIPGNYLQAVYADSLPGQAQRYFGDLTTREGWNLYASLIMRKSGFTGYDPTFRLMQQKNYLELLFEIQSAINFHVKNISDRVVLDSLKQKTSADEPVLAYHWNQIYYKPAELIARFWGFYQIDQLNEDYRIQQGNFYSQLQFNTQLISSGLIPISIIREKLLPPPKPEGLKP